MTAAAVPLEEQGQLFAAAEAQRAAEAAGLQKIDAGACEANAPDDDLENLRAVQLVPAA